MALPVLPNSVLDRPAPRILVDVHFASSFPLTLPHTFGGTITQLSTTDEYPGAAPLSGLYEGRLLVDGLALKLGAPNEFGGVQRVEEVSFTIGNADGAYNFVFTQEVRGKLVTVHFWDAITDELQEAVFVGRISAVASRLHVVAITATALALGQLLDLVPRETVTPATFPLMDVATGSAGTTLAWGIGYGERVPLRNVRAAGEAFDYLIQGNVAVHRVWQGDAPLSGNLDPDGAPYFAVLHREYFVGGRYATALRFFRRQVVGASLVPITADVLRAYPDVDNAVRAEWKWTAYEGFTEAIGGHVATSVGATPLTTGDLVPGIAEMALGGVRLNGVDQVLALDGGVFGDPALEPIWTVEIAIYPEATAADGGERVFFVSPNAVVNTGASGRGWWLAWDAATERVRAYVKYDDGANPHQLLDEEADIPAPRRQWTIVTLTVAGGATAFGLLSIDGEPAGSVSGSDPVLYGAAANPLLGGDASASFFKGVLGWVRVSAADRGLRYRRTATMLLRCHPLALAEELWERQLHQRIDASDVVGTDKSWDTARAAIRAVDGGTLRADGWVTEATPARDVLAALVPFRDLRFTRAADGAVACEADTPAVEAKGTFGIGDDFGNLLALVERRRASDVEAVAALPLAFRQARDVAGALVGYQVQDYRILANAVGIVAEPFVLPFVWDARTADVIGKLRADKLRVGDELLVVDAAHEARALAPRHVVVLNLPGEGIVGAEYRVATVDRDAKQHRLALTPYDAAPYTYVKPNHREAILAHRADLVGFWRLGEVSGATAAHDSDHARIDGAYVGDVLLGIEKLLHAADPATGVRLDGATAYVEFGDHALWDFQPAVGALTVHLVYRCTNAAAGLGWVAAKQATDRGWWIDFDPSTDTLRASLQSSGGSIVASAVVAGLDDGTPHVLDAVFTAAVVTLFVDGVQVATQAGTTGGTYGTTNPLRLGVDSAALSGFSALAAQDLALFDADLSAAVPALTAAAVVEPRILPPDPVAGAGVSVDVAETQLITVDGEYSAVAVIPAGTAPLLAVEFERAAGSLVGAKDPATIVAPGGVGVTVVGATTAAEAVSFPDDESYVALVDPGGFQPAVLFPVEAPAQPAKPGYTIHRLVLDAYLAMPSAGATMSFALLCRSQATVAAVDFELVSSGLYEIFTATFPYDPAFTTPTRFTFDALRNVAIGVRHNGGPELRLTALKASLFQGVNLDDAVSPFTVRWYRSADRFFVPTEDSAPAAIFSGTRVYSPPPPAVGTYYYTARIYDVLGRFIAQTQRREVRYE